jgi:lysozyme
MYLALLMLPATAPHAELAGIDVSHHNGSINWSLVKKGLVGFAYVKASEGMDDIDPLFVANWNSLGEQGIPRGAYHFFVTEDDPQEQAKLFLSVYQPQEGDLLPAIDIEVLGKGSGTDAPERLRVFIELIRAAVGTSPVIYTSARFWDTDMASTPELLIAIRDCPLWIAEYEVTAPKIPEGWTRWTIWQWEPDGAIAGISGGVDRNRLHQNVSIADIQIPARERD